MNLAEFSEERFELCSLLTKLKWDERLWCVIPEDRVKARKRWSEVEGFEAYLESKSTSKVRTPHGL